MIQVFGASWALFLGMFMLMIGNGLQGTLLGLRGEMEGFTTLELSVVMSAYFAGFLFASKMVPKMIQRVGHVRVFAALGSTISAVLILYPTLAEPWAWTIGRVVIGFCFCGVYVTAESWLNDASTNETRGQSLSIYMIVQMAGIVFAQYILSRGDVGGYILFIIPSVMVSLAFAPILLSVKPTPAFDQTKPMTIRKMIDASPLACFGMFMLGGVFSAQFGMSAIYAARAGFTVAEVSLFVSAIYVAALVAQYPIGWASDRMDRRLLIVWVCVIGAIGALIGAVLPSSLFVALVAGALVGGTSNPLYALLIAYANDYLAREDMAAASGGLLFINGIGAIAGPLIVGAMLDIYGPQGYWVFLAVLLGGVAIYAVWRMARRSRSALDLDTVPYAQVGPSTTPIVAEMAQEWYLDGDAAEEDPQP
ncbi:MFS transporter [Yoonia sp. R2331]|uniref:MFS transporter n=1 Tax=Yoonia sp. R2331 TaxID=3237238 RepID=UPI0034E59109